MFGRVFHSEEIKENIDSYVFVIEYIINNISKNMPMLHQMLPFILEHIDSATDKKIIKEFRHVNLANAIERTEFLMFVVENIDNESSKMLKHMKKMINSYLNVSKIAYQLKYGLMPTTKSKFLMTIDEFYKDYDFMLYVMKHSPLAKKKSVKNFINAQYITLNTFIEFIIEYAS